VPGIIVDPGINGDFNLNGVVDAADFVVWRNTGRPPADYDLWRSRFGMTTGAGSGAATAGVPEPGFGLFAIAGIAASLLRLRRRSVRATRVMW
jgi:hypothetical protein